MAMTIGAMWLSTTEADAASVSISGVPSSVTKGQSFTVTVTYYGETWGVAVGYFTCSSNLSIVSGSSYSLYSSSGVSSLSASATVTATGTGSGSVTAHTTSAANFGTSTEPPADVYPGSATGYVTVSEPAKSSSSSSSSSSSKSSSSSSNKSNNKSTSKSTSKNSTKTEKSDDPQAEKEAKKEEAEEEAKAKETTIEVEVNGVKYTVVESKKNIPEGFSTATFKYGDKEIQGIQSDDKKYAMVKLTPSDGSGKATWFFFDEETGTFTDSATLSPSDIIAMYKSEESETPLMWVAMTIVLGTLVIVLSACMYKMKKSEGTVEFENAEEKAPISPKH